MEAVHQSDSGGRDLCRPHPPESSERFGSYLLRGELAQHVRQDAVVAVVLDLDRRVDARDDAERLHGAVRGSGTDAELLAGSQAFRDAFDIEDFLAREAE